MKKMRETSPKKRVAIVDGAASLRRGTDARGRKAAQPATTLSPAPPRPPVPETAAAREVSPDFIRRGEATMRDLCVEDKDKISKMMQQLLEVGERHDRLASELEDERKEIVKRDALVSELREQNSIVMEDSTQLRTKFSQALHLLKQYQQRIETMGEEQHLKSTESDSLVKGLKAELDLLRDQLNYANTSYANRAAQLVPGITQPMGGSPMLPPPWLYPPPAGAGLAELYNANFLAPQAVATMPQPPMPVAVPSGVVPSATTEGSTGPSATPNGNRESPGGISALSFTPTTDAHSTPTTTPVPKPEQSPAPSSPAAEHTHTEQPLRPTIDIMCADDVHSVSTSSDPPTTTRSQEELSAAEIRRRRRQRATAHSDRSATSEAPTTTQSQVSDDDVEGLDSSLDGTDRLEVSAIVHADVRPRPREGRAQPRPRRAPEEEERQLLQRMGQLAPARAPALSDSSDSEDDLPAARDLDLVMALNRHIGGHDPALRTPRRDRTGSSVDGMLLELLDELGSPIKRP